MRFAPILLLLVASPIVAQDKGIRFPEFTPPSTPVAVSRLPADALYVIDSDIPIFLKLVQDGLVDVTEEVGPIRIRGKFVDGERSETRLFKGKQVFIVSAIGSGTLDLLVIPVGVTKLADVIHKKIDVEGAGIPDPKPKPKPDEPKPGLVAHCTFIGANVDSVAVVNSKEIRDYLKSSGVKGWVLAADDLTLEERGFLPVIKKLGGTPVIILQDAKGNVVSASKMTNVTENFQWIKTQVGK